MSSGAQVIGAATVTVDVDDSKFQEALNKMPAKARAKVEETVKAIQDKIASKKIEFDVAFEGGDVGVAAAAQAQLGKLEAKLNDVKRKALDMGNGVGKGGGDAAQGLLRLGQAIDDVRYGFGAIVN